MSVLVLVCSAFLLTSSVTAFRLPFIVGGNDVDEAGKWPWQASLQMLGSHICGAALIDNQWVLTAAHCVQMPFTLTVVLGLHDMYTQNEGDPMSFETAQIIKHPGFSMDSTEGYPNDIALIKLKTLAPTDNTFIKPATLPAADVGDLVGSECWITGWGLTRDGSGQIPNILQEAEVTPFTNTECNSIWAGAGAGDIVNDGHICVGFNDQHGACSGDSGGPLVCNVTSNWVLSGVTSWGHISCNPKWPSVYTRVSYFRDWIDENMQ